MEQFSEIPGTTGTTGADDLATILSAFGRQGRVVKELPHRVVAWNSPRFGRCTGRVHLVSPDDWLAISLSMTDELVWVRNRLVSEIDATSAGNGE